MRGTLRVAAGTALVAAAALAVVAVVVGAPWLWAVVGACAVAGAAAAAGSARAAGRTSTSPATHHTAADAADAAVAPAAGPVVREVDDLPTFFASPPGSPTALPAAPGAAAPAAPPATAGAAPAPHPAPHPAPDPVLDPTPDPATDRTSDAAPGGSGRSRRRSGGLAAVVVLVVALVVVAVVVGVAGSTGTRDASPAGTSSTGRAGTPGGSTATGAAATAASSPPAPLTAAAAGDLADLDLPTGDDGFTASLTFPGVVLEPRAVGVTVAYPVLTVDSDGASTVAHLDLPVWNCLAGSPPADPVAAQCTRSLEEHADLGSPDLVVERGDGGADLSGAFATYTRPNGSAPSYTGRSYPVTATITAQAGRGTGVAGSLTLGGTRVEATGEGSFSR